MDEESRNAVNAACERMEGLHLPRWRELPDLELYMDQVLELTARYLESWPAFDRKGLTASMVNNYVMQGVLPKPEKKRYARRHLARLLVICVLKGSLPIAAIRAMLEREMRPEAEEAFYEGFCRRFEAAGAEAARLALGSEDGFSPAAEAALRAQAEQALALRLCGELYPAEPETRRRK